MVLGASAGGVLALRQLVAGLPADLPAAVFVVLHLSPAHRSMLPEILTAAGELPARFAADGEAIERGVVYVAPPGYHLLLTPDQVRLSEGPRENSQRPAIDPLFRSAGVAFGPRAIGVVLSGMLSDGSAGLRALAQCGGVAVVQEPADAEHGDMPTAALAATAVDHRVNLDELPALLVRLTAEAPGPERPVPRRVQAEADAAFGDITPLRWDQLGPLSEVVCPECGGALREIDDGGLMRFRCHTGHSFTSSSVVSSQTEAVERALWVAIRVLEERLRLCARFAEESRERGHAGIARTWQRRAAEAEHHAELLRSIILSQAAPLVAEQQSELAAGPMLRRHEG
ncbi:MAG TPA: chemotaxis protein CheB [Thermoanaerobaculia bacterium]|nr:chemotaxis protein CheB [Thermoanaerobaculia bacterium]